MSESDSSEKVFAPFDVYLVNPHVPTSGRLAARIDLTGFSEEAVSEAVNEISRKLAEIDRKYAVGNASGRSKRVAVFYARVEGEGGRQERRVMMQFTPYPSALINSVDRLRSVVYDELKLHSFGLRNGGAGGVDGEAVTDRLVTKTGVVRVVEKVARLNEEKVKKIREAIRRFEQLDDFAELAEIVKRTTGAELPRLGGKADSAVFPDIEVSFSKPGVFFSEFESLLEEGARESIRRASEKVERAEEDARREAEEFRRRALEEARRAAEEERARIVEEVKRQTRERLQGLLEAVKKAADAKGMKYQSVVERLRDVAGYAKDLGFRDVESSANTAAKAVELAAALDGEGIAQLAKNLGIVAVGDVRTDLKNIAIRLLDEPARAAEEKAAVTDASVAEPGGEKRVSVGGEAKDAGLDSLVDQIVRGVSF
ncbi:hypothetical protein B9Q03_08095 [Candidatus Marsarchaeota G2 archaeon OSP_D]|jgi:hypothetical protein|uniref:Uncharacterized protein n=1 Tax=Candidatus Marsarchaeota G2 archaeon OSP_D TaxID=1978157 RepID=A0A2R6ATV4_9ARCH|nr:MAG: hypothetical protein B9Q03_08095 [Candidatus Marsarchaeota G2 archaeon OSP_D]